MPDKTTSVTITGNHYPAYVMGRPRSAYQQALAAKASVRAITPVTSQLAEALLAA